MEEINEYTIEDYNNEPVYYCKHCLSLKIKVFGGYDFCDECGSTHIHTDHINNWEKLYEERYGNKFLDEGKEDYYSFLK